MSTLLGIGSETTANTREMEHSYNPEVKDNSEHQLPKQPKEVNEMECPGVYRINCKDCEQKYIGKTGRTINTRIKENQRLCIKMDTEKSEIAEHTALTGHTIGWSATERLSSYGRKHRKTEDHGVRGYPLSRRPDEQKIEKKTSQQKFCVLPEQTWRFREEY
ncbi:unnamed protein product [Protopolystoma xenopodis]|uniref:GIY-YIG domain-containing protein n=1 Tax=Protopolystoma xenopodis TaxID=117903 RepID=A0A448WHM9_9PLAT|nr:unnamed protein product [Protopolystoma xenopodis]